MAQSDRVLCLNRHVCCSGVPQSVAMSISGHKTISMFNRYNITSGADKIEALRKTAEHLATHAP